MADDRREGRVPSAAPDPSPTGIEIDGKQYELPTLDTITLDEERILYIYADTVVQDFIPAHPDASDEDKALYQQLQLRKIRNPDFKKALAHIAYKRENREADDAEIQAAIGLVNALEVDVAMLRGDEDPHQTSQKQPGSKTSTSEHSSSTDSGRDTETSSDLAVESLGDTGTTGSETSSRGAHLIALEN